MHCAAELGHLVPLSNLDGELWQRLLHVNLSAPFLMTRELLPLLIKSAPATVVFVGDSAVGAGKAYWGAYGVAKIALHGYTRILADEMESFGLKVHLFTPGPMRTPIRRMAYPSENPDTLTPPETPADSLLDLMSPSSTTAR